MAGVNAADHRAFQRTPAQSPRESPARRSGANYSSPTACRKRKYTAVLRATLVGGRVIEDLIVEEGWIIATNRDGLGGTFEQRIDFDPRQITDVEIKQVV